MELANIEKLVHKYLDAETNLAEEQLLKEYFSSNEVPPHLESYQAMFGYFNQSKSETFTKTIQLEPRKQKKSLKWLSVAASIALVVSMYVGYGEYQHRQQAAQLAQVTEALKLLSTNLKKGNDAVANLYAYEKTVNKVFKTK